MPYSTFDKPYATSIERLTMTGKSNLQTFADESVLGNHTAKG